MASVWTVWVLLLWPALGAGGCVLLPRPRAVLALVVGSALTTSALAAAVAASVFQAGPLAAAGGWLYIDALSAYHLVLLAVVFVSSSLYAWTYFLREQARGRFTPAAARRFGALWLGAMAAVILVVTSNNLAISWVGVEATTLLMAFLICTHVSPASLEATWKCLIMCSVGVAFAFIGILLLAAARPAGLPVADAMLWTRLNAAAGSMNAPLLKIAFIFLLVGYGTKAGLAPMHNWLPDAYSQAPSPVSAISSGVLLNAALYGILRCLPLVETATGNARWAMDILTGMGILSILVAAAFIVLQRDAKRLLAYSSIEHMGIITLGVGLGGVGTFAALFHALNHSLGKPLAFFAAGRLRQILGTPDLFVLAGAARSQPLWGRAFLLSFLALIGVAPFALFLSEFQILKAALDGRHFVLAVAFLVGLAVVFLGALRGAIRVAWDNPTTPAPTEPTGLIDKFVVLAPLLALLVLGLWMPPALRTVLDQAATIIRGGL